MEINTRTDDYKHLSPIRDRNLTTTGKEVQYHLSTYARDRIQDLKQLAGSLSRIDDQILQNERQIREMQRLGERASTKRTSPLRNKSTARSRENGYDHEEDYISGLAKSSRFFDRNEFSLEREIPKPEIKRPNPEPMSYKSRFGQLMSTKAHDTQKQRHFTETNLPLVNPNEEEHNDSHNLSGYLKNMNQSQELGLTERYSLAVHGPPPGELDPRKFSKEYLDYINELEAKRNFDMLKLRNQQLLGHQ